MADRESRAYRVFLALRSQIVSGELAVGTQLPSRQTLAAAWGVSVYAMRQVEAWLAAAGFIRAEPGRGTIVQTPVAPTVLLVATEAAVEELLIEDLARSGYRLVAAASPAEGLAALGRDAAIALVLIDFGNLTPADGIKFIRRVRHRWPQIPVAVLVAETAALTPLRGTPEWPLLIVPKPIQSRQLDELLRLTPLRGATREPAPLEGGAT